MRPGRGHAQAVPAAMIAVVDLERVTAECNACKTAAAALRSQGHGASEPAQKALATPLETERQVDPGRDRRARRARSPTPRFRRGSRRSRPSGRPARQEMSRAAGSRCSATRHTSRSRSRDKLGPIYQQVMQQPRRQRHARSRLDAGDNAPRIDVTPDVLAALNAALPTIATTAPAPRAQQQPQGR